MANADFAIRPSSDVCRARLEQSERFNAVFDRFDAVCREFGYQNYGDFVAAVKNFQRTANLPISHSKVRRAGLRGTGKRALPDDLAAGMKLEKDGKSLAEISRILGLSYQTVAKYSRHEWCNASDWKKRQQAQSPSQS